MSPGLSASPGPARPELVVVTGLDHSTVERVARAMCRLDDTAGVAHNLRTAAAGVVARWVRCDGGESVELMKVAPQRALDVVRDDLRTCLTRLAAERSVRRIVLPLDPTLEPGPVCRDLFGPIGSPTGLAEQLTVRGVITVVAEAGWMDDATGSATLADRGFAVGPQDTRTVAQVAVEQVESADAIVLTGHANLSTAVRSGLVLERLAPAARRRRIDVDVDADWILDGCGGAPNARAAVDVHGPLLHNEPLLHQDGGVGWVLMSSPIPMHPGRLHDVVPDLLAAAVRTRGRVWLAGRPEDVLWLESAGRGMRVERSGHWLAAGGDGGWAAADAHRRAFAALRWHPRFGDRAQDLAVLVHRGTGAKLAARLRSALLTSRELAMGPVQWSRWPDPFGDAHADPCSIVHQASGMNAPHVLPARG